ncbi:MAG: XdhC/CoxI family protein [Thermoplasmata archaeon]|nr:XdhC/CoxI family protein [Thermoplasmata archaeon]
MDRRLTREALRLMKAHLSFARATVVRATDSVPGKVGATMLVRQDGSAVGTVGGAALEEEVKALASKAILERASSYQHFELKSWVEGGLPSLCGGAVDILIEFVPARPNVLLWGGGHVAHALARILPTLQYDYSVADDRPDWIGADRFADAERREAVGPSELFDRLAPEEFTHLFVLGYDARKDTDVLQAALARFPNAIGFIASRAKRAHIFAELRRRGASEAEIGRIHAPVGLAIGAETPEEIAISIVAELVRGLHPERTDKNPDASRASTAPHGARARR